MGASEHRPLRVVEFDVSPAPTSPGPEELAEAAAGLGAHRLVFDAWNTADGWAVVHGGPTIEREDGSRQPIADVTLRGSGAKAAPDTVEQALHTVEEALLAAHRRRIGIHFRIHERSIVRPLAAALGVSGGEGHAVLRRRFLVVAGDAKVGRWLRAEAPDVPSAVELPTSGRGWRGALGRRMPNLARAAADADDLILPRPLAGSTARMAALARKLGRRGAYLWVSGVSPAEADALLADDALRGLGGVIVRRQF